jgi:ubiquinone/menaquinone biosynthesis C-methylase UbiE
MATEFPECEFLGIDVAPLQPTTILPQNCSFELVNVLEGIPRPDSWFDYVRQRFLTSAIPADKWKPHIQECIRVCSSGGWVEIIETNGQIADGGPACENFNAWTTEAFKKRGMDINLIKNLEELLHEAGLTNVTKQVFTAPFGSWGGKAGELFADDYRIVNNSLQPLITSALGVPKEEVEKNGALMMEEFKSHQAYMNIYVYVGQKK